MKTPSFRQSTLALALGLGSVAVATPLTALSAPVGNMATSADNRFTVTLGANRSNRDMKQDGSTAIWSATESQTSGGYTEEYEFSERVRGIDAEQEQTDLYAQLSFAVTPRIEVYGRAGATKSELKDFGDFESGSRESYSLTESDGANVSDSQEFYFTESGDALDSTSTDMGWMIGIGAKISLYEWESQGLGLTLDALYLHRDTGDGDTVYSPEAFIDSVEVTGNKSDEWQAALILEKRTGNFRPYGGIKYARIDSEYDVRTKLNDSVSVPPEFTVDSTGTVELENEDNIGVVGGMEYLFTPAMSLAAEVRGGDETAFNVAFRYRF
ncbi:MAG: hypothetical protein ACQER6_09270 [Pseudomonadota bacterium]